MIHMDPVIFVELAKAPIEVLARNAEQSPISTREFFGDLAGNSVEFRERHDSPGGLYRGHYPTCFFAKFTLHKMLRAATPAKHAPIAKSPPLATRPTRARTYPMTKFTSDQSTFTSGDDSPLPGGLANGVGNRSPQIPFTKWGTKLVRKRPAKKQAT
jgi:hypothetical protein